LQKYELLFDRLTTNGNGCSTGSPRMDQSRYRHPEPRAFRTVEGCFWSFARGLKDKEFCPLASYLIRPWQDRCGWGWSAGRGFLVPMLRMGTRTSEAHCPAKVILSPPQPWTLGMQGVTPGAPPKPSPPRPAATGRAGGQRETSPGPEAAAAPAPPGRERPDHH